jgi:hypothetical protein
MSSCRGSLHFSFTRHSAANVPQNKQSFFFHPLLSFTVIIMKLHASTALLFFSAAATLTTLTVTRAQPQDHLHRSHHRDTLVARAARDELAFAAAKRQAGPVVAAAAAPPAPSGSTSSSSSASAGPAVPLTTSSGAHGTGTSTTPSLSAASGTGMTGSGSGSSQPTPLPTGPNGVPPLSLISSGMLPGTPSPVATTYPPGATPPFSGAPALPAQCTYPPARLVSWLFVAHGF